MDGIQNSSIRVDFSKKKNTLFIHELRSKAFFLGLMIGIAATAVIFCVASFFDWI